MIKGDDEMENVIKFDKNFGKTKDRENMDFDKITLFDENNQELNTEKRKQYIDFLYDSMESNDSPSDNVLIALEYGNVENFLKNCENKVSVTSYEANAGNDLFEGLKNIRSFHIMCVIEGSPTSQLGEILFMEKPFVNDLILGVKVNYELNSEFKVTAFYAPTTK